MQERYLGDSHDFLKYGLLRHLALSLEIKLGVNWYLTLPHEVDFPGNNDGGKRQHLTDINWQRIDPDLLGRIRSFENVNERRLNNVAAWGLLPSETLYFDEAVPSDNRQAWFAQSLDALSGADLIFLDPDNGFEVASMTRRTKPKYALYEEAAACLEAGKIVVGIQFARQCDPIQRARDIRDRLIKKHGKAASYPVIRGRVAPNILFFTLAALPLRDGIIDAVRAFVGKAKGSGPLSKVELID